MPFHRRSSSFRVGLWLLVLAAICPDLAMGQDIREDYARADRLRERSQGKVFRDRVTPHWFANNDRFWYRVSLAGGASEFLVVDAVGGDRHPAFDHAKLAASLAKATEKPVAADHPPFDLIQIEDDGRVRFLANGTGWSYDPAADSLGKDNAPLRLIDDSQTSRIGALFRPRPGTRRGNNSPDGHWTAFVKDHDLHLRDRKSGEEISLGDDGTEEDSYDGGVYWSPDSRHVVALRTKKGEDHKVFLIESSPRGQVQPKLSSYDYLKPGDRIPTSKPHLFDVEARKQIPVADALFDNPWSIEEIRWSPDNQRFTFLYNQRGHQVLRLMAVDAATGAASALIEETSPTFIDYSNKTYLQILDKSNEILWMSERDGWNHLYLIDGQTGKVKNPVTRGDWLIRQIEWVDDAKRQVWFRALGIVPGQDPYHVHYARINFDGTGLTLLTEGDGNHQVEFSPDRRFLIDTYSRVDLPPVTVLRRGEDGRKVCDLEQADVSALRETGWAVPERFVARARDGQTEIHGVLFTPTHLDPAKKYPVIEQIYAGPQGAFVPKSFAPFHQTQALAELGFIVVQIDGMGTNWRSRAFHDVCWKNLGDAGLPDRILWIKAAAEKHPYFDLSRVGVYGGSAGGQNALGAMLFHGDFYKAAVADCGCHDNRMDKIWWNEAWMGWPIGPHYAAQSNVTNAHKLRGALLLTVGELDHNVDPASTMQVVNALIKANKDFDLVVFPGAGHGAGGSPYGRRRMRDFFVKHLRGIEPPPRNAVAAETP